MPIGEEQKGLYTVRLNGKNVAALNEPPVSEIPMLKSAHYAAINLLFNNGHSKRAIARLTSHDRKTVDKVLRAQAPAVAQRRIRKHKLDAFRTPWSNNSGQDA